ncbi:MAG: M1 family metallopeptidase [Candidatus Kapaibacterium sp.]
MVRTLSLLLPLLLIVATLSAQPLPSVEYSGGARSHPFDLIHTALDVRLDFDNEVVSGTVTHNFRSLSPTLSKIQLDAAQTMTISSLTVDDQTARFVLEGQSLQITLPKTLSYDELFTIKIEYSVSPKKGIYFVKKEENEPEGRDQIWTQGEGEDHHFWIPMYDYPNDLATSEIRATIRSDWKLLSNGEFVSTASNGDGTTTWHYKMTKPHAPYLMMLAASDYLVTRDTVRDIPLEYWSYPDMPDRVEPSFGRTPEIVSYLEDLIGIPYPWNKYSQVMIDEFMYGGMENTTATTLNDFALVDKQGLIDYNPDGLIAHEAAHQWFGDLVTNRSWDHLWLHESFATYLAARWTEHSEGENAYLAQISGYIAGGINTDKELGRSPIAGGKGYTPNIYGRGAAVLHMLNKLVGEELFWRSIRLFLTRHAHAVVETNDLKLAFEDATGYNLNWFFDQWVYGAGMPVLEIEEDYDDGIYQLKLKQKQERDTLTGYFKLAVPIEIFRRGEGGLEVIVDTVVLTAEEQTVSYKTSKPIAVAIDAYNMLIEVKPMKTSNEGLLAILEFASSPVVRERAARRIEEEVGSKKGDVATQVKRIYALEKVPYVKAAMISAIAALDKKVALEVIPAALADENRDIRMAGVSSAWAIEDKNLRTELLLPLLKDSSFSIVAETLGMLVESGATGLEPSLTELQYVEGQRESIARAWMDVVAAGKFVQFVDRVAWYAQNASRGWTRSTALTTLGKLKVVTPEVRSAVINGVKNENLGVFKSALTAAEELDDKELNLQLQVEANTMKGERRKMLEDVL